MAAFHVSALTSMVDEKIIIRASGLDAGSKVTIRSFLVESHFKFEAHAHYVANQRGEVHIADQPSLGGSYTGIESMGLFWSMGASPGQRQGLRYGKRDVTTPVTVTLSLHEGHLDTLTLQTDNPVTSITVNRWYMAKNVERIPIRQGRIRGVLFKPRGPGPFPGVIDTFGGAGGCIQIRASLLASHGFAALALAWFNYEDLSKAVWNKDFEYFEEATNWLYQEPYVEPGGIGAVGVSSGAMIVLLMASLLPDKISAVVSISGPVTMIPFPITIRGEPMEYLNYNVERTQRKADGSCIARYCPDGLHFASEASKIKVENARNLLFVIGQDDLNWPTDEHAAEAMKRLNAHGHQGYKILSYPGAGHLIEPPYAPLTMASYFPLAGTPKPHADAQEDSWKNILDFLCKHVGHQTHSVNYPYNSSSKL